MYKVAKLLHKNLGLLDESIIRSEEDEIEIKKEWGELYGLVNSERFKNFHIVIGEVENPFMYPQKLSLCKYDLVGFNLKPKVIVTEKHNRELILKDLITIAKENSKVSGYDLRFKIFLTTQGIKTVIIDSKLDKQFIKFLINGKVQID